MNKRDVFRIRCGAAALFASGLLTAVGLYLRGPNLVDITTDTQRIIEVASSSQHILAQAFLMPNLIIQIFGFWGLYAFLANTSVDRPAFWGAVLCIAANALFLPFAGIVAFIAPPVADLYLQGNTEVIQIYHQGLYSAFARPFLAGSALLILVGALFFAVAIWRSDRLPKWAGVLFFLHAIGIGPAAEFSYAVEYTGALMLLVSTTWIAWAIWRETGPQAA